MKRRAKKAQIESTMWIKASVQLFAVQRGASLASKVISGLAANGVVAGGLIDSETYSPPPIDSFMILI